MVDATVLAVGFYILFAFLALICEYVDSSMGGGYGTILVPVLLAFNIDRYLLIPAVLFTEVWTGFGSAALHHYVGNANFRIYFKKKDKTMKNRKMEMSDDFKISTILAGCGIIGGIVAAFIAISINEVAMKTYIGVLVFLVGFFVLLKLKWKFSWWKISGIGLVAAFNKGLSGGGYGPLISSGQIIVDRNPRQAVASTSLSEAVVCVASLIIYFTANGATLTPAFGFLVLALFVGSILSVPLAVFTVKYISISKIQPIIGLSTILLGVFTIVNIYAF